MWYHDQKVGDLVIVPPMVPHTVINSGEFSCAVAANILNVDVVDEVFFSFTSEHQIL